MKAKCSNYKNYLMPVVLIVFICFSIVFLASQIGIVYSHFRDTLGPVFIVLLGLTTLFISCLIQIFMKKDKENLPETSLDIVYYASPIVGLLGTFISLMNGLITLNLGNTALLTAIRHLTLTVGRSLSTTVYGMSLGLCAMLVILIFIEPAKKKTNRLPPEGE